MKYTTIRIIIFVFSLSYNFLNGQEIKPDEEPAPKRIIETKNENSNSTSTSHIPEENFFKLEEKIVVTASRSKENIRKAPASIVVVSEEDIKNRGYTSIDEILYDLPGFDVIFPDGSFYITAYQRGYRTPYTNRTLIMIDGKIDNSLYFQTADISRQYSVSNIKRIEILYGPASVMYGPNAFQGVINIITKNPKDNKEENSPGGKLLLQYGSYSTIAADGNVTFRSGDFGFSATAKALNSKGPDLSNRGGYLSNYWSGNLDAWGPILQQGDAGKKFGTYSDPARDYSAHVMGNIANLKMGIMHWTVQEGYGTYWPNDRVQNGALWSKASTMYYIENDVQLTKAIRSYSLISYRENPLYGNFAQAVPDNKDNRYSNVSYTRWVTENSSQLMNQNFEIKISNSLELLLGVKYESKRLTKFYDVPGYTTTSYSSVTIPAGYRGNVYSTEPFYLRPPPQADKMPENNLISTTDYGGFTQGKLIVNKFIFSPGIRYDENSIYGHSVNPRISNIYLLNDSTTLKLLYGEAFNEPPQYQLYGGFAGRQTNISLKPEKVRSTEFIIMKEGRNNLQEVSIYYQRYENVIKEEAENAGRRRIYGGEYKLNFHLKNFLDINIPLKSYLNYTFTEALSQIEYDRNSKKWRTGSSIAGDNEIYLPRATVDILPRREEYMTLGDIARHKLNIGTNIPILQNLFIDLRTQYVGKRTLYLSNPLRWEGKTIDPYVLFHLHISWEFFKAMNLAIKINNLFNTGITHPGVDLANAGDNYYARSQGFRPSLHPQPGRSFLVIFTYTF
jgi:iron complex outermembrane receptor protein